MTDLTIGREHLTVEQGTAEWGGPTAKATVTAGPLNGRTFWLRSTQGLGSDTTNDLAKGGGIHLDASDPNGGNGHDWRGAYKTFDMDEALGLLVGEVNDLAVRERVQDATWAETSALREAFDAFTDGLGESSRHDWQAEWRRVQDAVAALEMKIQEASRG